MGFHGGYPRRLTVRIVDHRVDALDAPGDVRRALPQILAGDRPVGGHGPEAGIDVHPVRVDTLLGDELGP